MLSAITWIAYVVAFLGILLAYKGIRFWILLRKAKHLMANTDKASALVRAATFARLSRRFESAYGKDAKPLAAAVSSVLFSEDLRPSSSGWHISRTKPQIVKDEVCALKDDAELLGMVHLALSEEIGVNGARGMTANSIKARFDKLED